MDTFEDVTPPRLLHWNPISHLPRLPEGNGGQGPMIDHEYYMRRAIEKSIGRVC